MSSAVPEVGKSLFFIGLAIALVGVMLWTGFGRSWFGQLPETSMSGEGALNSTSQS
jgi:hypothetical protein